MAQAGRRTPLHLLTPTLLRLAPRRHGEPRSSGVVYKAVDRRLYIAVAPDSWKARQIAVRRRVSVTVPVRRGGLLSLVLPIPPATISFHATAKVHSPGSPEGPRPVEGAGRPLA